ncbi:MAG: ACP S-malonyltransferase [Oscillospiraceae bacterium]|nr:ACP S-malonyltransferase [Oscillospiraceae bacterium]
MNKTALLFPGQGAQYAGMGKDFSDLEGVLAAAGEIVGFDVKKMCFEGTAEELAQTRVSQPCIMACSLAAFYDFVADGGEFSAVAGHSLGEYAAMVAAEIVSLDDGFRLIKARSEAMQKAAESASGAMYAIIGLAADEVEKICSETDGYVVPVNYNSPVQTVIAGETPAAEAAAAKFAELKAKTIKLGVSSAFHSKLMQPAADEFYEFAKTIEYRAPKVKFFSNVLGDELLDFSSMPEMLAKHIVSPVRFSAEIERLSALGYTSFNETGPGKVLTGLVKKTIKGK